jgi:alpha-glucosidase (family GH31 glycosyl hydrolase)
MRSAALVICVALVAAGCSDTPCGATDLAASYSLEAPGITVELETSPLALRVIDGAGTTVIETATPGEGYAAASWTTGIVETKAFPAPGYFSFQAVLEPWHDLELVGVDQRSPTSAILHLHDRSGGDTCVIMTLTLRDHALRVEATARSATPRAWSVGFASPSDEAFLGFGERFNRTNQRGVAVYSYAEEGGIGTGEGMIASPDNPYPNGESMAYYPVPFFVSTRGYAFWLDTTWRSQFELATERDDAWRVWHVGPTLAYEIYTPTTDGTDTRPWPYHLIDRFTAATGRPMVPPAWVYGPRRRINIGDVQGAVSEPQAMRDLDLAITGIDDAVHFYPNGGHLGNEAGLAAWTASARALGYRVNGYYNSMINQAATSPLAPRAAQGLDSSYFLTRADGTFPSVYVLTGGNFIDLYVVDFTREGASAWYGESFDWATELGYSGWMYDFGEYVQADAVAANGMTGEELHNLYPVIYAQAVHDHMQASTHANDWLAFMRSGYTGSSAFVPAKWAGDPASSFEDSDGLPSMVRAGINIGLSGVPNWGGDIGGYHCIRDGTGAANGELLARWIEQGALTPIMMDQDSCVGGEPDLKASIFNSSDAQTAWRTYARLHTRLAPYLYALGTAANATGAPIMRHVFLEHPDHPELASEDTAYYLGPALFVAPILTRDARSRTVTLPPGTFLEWQPPGGPAITPSVLAGGQPVVLDAPLDKLPLLLRAGHLVPLLDPTIDTLSDETSPDIVSPADVADVYDVVGLLVPSQHASLSLPDGTHLDATWSSGFAPPALTEVSDDATLSTCTGCFRHTQLAPGLERVQISATGDVAAGGLALAAAGPRRIRWDLYIVTP